MSLGNRLFGRRADRSRRPVQLYGWLEIGIGLYAFLFPGLDKAIAALNAGALDEAQRLVALARVEYPDNPDAEYVSRIIERELQINALTTQPLPAR